MCSVRWSDRPGHHLDSETTRDGPQKLTQEPVFPQSRTIERKHLHHWHPTIGPQGLSAHIMLLQLLLTSFKDVHVLHVQIRLLRTVFLALLVHVTLSLAQQQNEPFDGDVIVYKSVQGSRPEDVGEPHYTFRRAGVSTLARVGDKIFIAFQNFDANRNDTANFDRISTSFSTDNGETWSQRKTVAFKGFPSNLQRPFDPTLVNDGGKLRMYFTSSNKASKRRRTAYYSAVSGDGGRDLYVRTRGPLLRGWP